LSNIASFIASFDKLIYGSSFDSRVKALVFKRSFIVGDKLQFLAQIRFLSIDTKGV